jgi:acetyl esterase/lipase
MRAMSEQKMKTNPPDYAGVLKSNISIPVRDGTSINGLVYKPATPPKSPSPLIVLYHGGGWVLGFPEAEEGTALVAVREFGAVVVSVDYRMAPEGPFPVPIEDSWDAVKWVSVVPPKPYLDLLIDGYDSLQLTQLPLELIQNQVSWLEEAQREGISPLL